MGGGRTTVIDGGVRCPKKDGHLGEGRIDRAPGACSSWLGGVI